MISVSELAAGKYLARSALGVVAKTRPYARRDEG
jgi:hypothetical protein